MTTFVSFAQNFEDVILWRALGHVPDGFYIDVGAYLPIDDSVTEAFYERGWRGINVEPNEACHALLVAERPRDTNLRCAISDVSGNAVMAFVSGTGLSTLDARQAQSRAGEGRSVVSESIPTLTLEELWAAHVPPIQEVHFLKVDVEGFERQVLLGNDWTHNRPWVVVVEAVDPTTRLPAHEAWEPILTGNDYQHVYSDGLNRFYLANERATLAPAFAYPPNVFDSFIRTSSDDRQFVATLARRVEAAEERARSADAAVRELRDSTSWKLTGPLRSAGRTMRKLLGSSR